MSKNFIFLKNHKLNPQNFFMSFGFIYLFNQHLTRDFFKNSPEIIIIYEKAENNFKLFF